jgi:hypothetical protein
VRFRLATAGRITLRLMGAAWYHAWIDGTFLNEGPPRFHPSHPEYEVLTLDLGAGDHVVAMHVHHSGVATQTQRSNLVPPFAMVDLEDAGGQPIATEWKCRQIDAWDRTDDRRSGLQGWVESVTMERLVRGWQALGFDDSTWDEPVEIEPFWESIRAAELAPIRQTPLSATLMASGLMGGHLRYMRNDIAIGFYTRPQQVMPAAATGRWWRFDLGRVRLGRPRVRLRAPKGAIVEVGMAEALTNGRVLPWVYLSLSASIWIDRFVADGTDDAMEPLVPRGGRFVEVHVEGDPAQVELLGFEFVERGYFPPHPMPVRLGDAALERIWHAGVETLRACAEDAIVDTPVRERGQWTGDTLSVGLELIATLYGDMRPIARAQRQVAQCARPDGLVASLTPGDNIIHFLSYACTWQESLWTLYLRAGNDAPMRELMAASLANLRFFAGRFSEEKGLSVDGELTFIDWGYLPLPGEPDLASTLFLRRAVRASAAAYAHLGDDAAAAFAADFLARIDNYLRPALATRSLETLGYHVTALALGEGLLSPTREADAVAYLKAHILDCFPNNPNAPRLYSPLVNHRRILTPYFSHFVLPLLIERGHMDFVLGVIRHCWGWSLGDGRTTLTEVFDEHWTHSHHWSACPTWILSQYGLGLRPAFHRGPGHWDFMLAPGSLPHGAGAFPGGVRVEWHREGAEIVWQVFTEDPVVLHDSSHRLGGAPLEVTSHATFRFPA